MPLFAPLRFAALLLTALPACAKSSDARTDAQRPPDRADSTGTTAPAAANDDALVASADSGRITGSPTAPVWVLEVSDFQCPYCKSWHDKTYPALRDEYIKTGKVRFAFVNLPLSFHEHAGAAAIAAMCASAQGKFWPMQESLFANQRVWARAENPAVALEQLAAATGVNVDAWRSCTKNRGIRDLIAADQDRVSRAGARATPSFLVNDQLIQGAVPIEPLRQAIDAALAASKKPKA